MNTANLKTPQHDVQELANQKFLQERLRNHYDKKRTDKCTLSVYLFMTHFYRRVLFNYLGFETIPSSNYDENVLKVWLRSAKMPVHGEALEVKGFVGTAFFAWFNQVRCPMILMNRKVKQHENSELKKK